MTPRARATRYLGWHWGHLVAVIVFALLAVSCAQTSSDDDDDDDGASGGSSATGGTGGAIGGAGGTGQGGGGGYGGGSGGGGLGPPDTIGPAGQFELQLDVDDVSRSYVLDVPQSAVDAMAFGPVPILFALHGAGDDGANFIAATGLTAAASAHGFVLVGPHGYNAGWFVQQDEGWPGTDGNNTSLQNDAQFLLDIFAETAISYYVDPYRQYAAGHSRGAGFTVLLAITSGQMPIASGSFHSPFAAYAVNAGYDPTQGSIDAGLSDAKRPVWVIHGSADSVVPASYGEDCADALSVAGFDTTWTSVSGAGHTWLFQSGYGQSNDDLWSFFASHSR